MSQAEDSHDVELVSYKPIDPLPPSYSGIGQ